MNRRQVSSRPAMSQMRSFRLRNTARDLIAEQRNKNVWNSSYHWQYNIRFTPVIIVVLSSRCNFSVFLDIYIFVTNKQCQFADCSSFLLNSNEQWIDKSKMKENNANRSICVCSLRFTNALLENKSKFRLIRLEQFQILYN